ncbi:tetratricopeptide repeat protein [Collinsella sp. zg1085]|uniref:tetratricopeptide repeat protein n=1 Tax=Collinsella sp. zg1085 TaxID=2844380 RepID=UPI001C0B4267|nr:tetratricopeptide repeat protein [Collinsella sp. zg1085]QWT17063.1 tetratricopeptide repeat protein [Collinsella sp. zg1085]
MDVQIFEQARAAYQSGDFAGAAQMFSASHDTAEPAGEAEHLRGNSLMRLGRYQEAAEAYGQALQDASYAKRGALFTNQGKAYVAAGNPALAKAAFMHATEDASYATPYKAHLGLGDINFAEGNTTEAGVAYRHAAIDGSNPAPALALTKLGSCFLLLNRPQDALESFRTASDFMGANEGHGAAFAGMGMAQFALGKIREAAEAFDQAASDASYQFTPEQAQTAQQVHDMQAAKNALAPQPQTGIDPLDPLGQSGAFMPDPSDTGFFTLTESEMIQQDRRDQKVRRRHRHVGLKIFLTFFVLLLLAAGGLAFAYTQGIGYPSQQDVVSNLFNAVTDGTDTNAYLAPGLTEEAKRVLVSSIPVGATPSIEGLDRSMTSSTATVKATLSRGGTQNYRVDFVRSGIGWTVSNIILDFGDTNATPASSGSTLSSEGTSTSTEPNSAPAHAATTEATPTTDMSSSTAAPTSPDTASSTSETADTPHTN